MTDRLPPLPEASLTAAQREARDRLLAGPRGHLVGPFIPLLRCPELMTQVQEVGAHLRYHGQLPAPVRELVILFVARVWNQDVEWQIHRPIAAAAGVRESTLTALAEGRDPVELTAAEREAYEFARALQTVGRVSDENYAAICTRFGEAGVVELSALIGYYTLLAMVLNVAQTPPPDSTGATLAPLPFRFPTTA